MMTAMDFARRMAAAGFPVLPIRCDDGGKRPRTRWKAGGYGERATWDEDVVDRWARLYPRDLYGVACGDTRDGHRLLVVDCDRHGTDPDAFLMGVIRWMTEVVGMSTEEASTMLIRTRSGGLHLWWWADDVADETIACWGNAVGISRRADGDPLDIDLRAPGRGYVVGPDMVSPGWHEGHYAIQADPEMMRRDGMRIRDMVREMPPALADWLTEQKRRQSEARGDVVVVGGDFSQAYVTPHEPVPQGTRNDAVWRWCRSRRHRIPPEKLRLAAHYFNAKFCTPPLDVGEVDRIVTHALTAA